MNLPPIPNPQSPIPPSSTIGIIGGGQLGRMLAIAAAQMGYHTHIFTPEVDAPAREVAKHTTVASYDSRDDLKRFARSVDVVTYEFENIPVAAVADIARHVNVFPSPEILATSQHRLLEKQAINTLGVATAPFAPVSNQEELNAAIKKLGLPAVLKTATMGYDGKGQWMLQPRDNLEKIWLEVTGDRKQVTENKHETSVTRNPPPVTFILEGFVDFRMEISVIVARDARGATECYCPVQNIHKDHILSETIVPAPISDALAQKAQAIAEVIASGLNLVGLMAVEMFVTNNDEIIVNELAPRPHNSGHWTIDACVTSQFEQTIRAICGLPLGSTEKLCDAKMRNLIGDDINDWQKYLAMPNARLHLYGKKEARPGRKMGHVTFLASAGA
jgi:5-(carboxyamino)imidazole ribonucleotide synthase